MKYLAFVVLLVLGIIYLGVFGLLLAGLLFWVGSKIFK